LKLGFGLVTVDEEASTVRLTHFTLQEYPPTISGLGIFLESLNFKKNFNKVPFPPLPDDYISNMLPVIRQGQTVV